MEIKKKLLIESCLALLIWIVLFTVFGTKFPYDYDSVNYALAIVDKFDLRLDQPHLPYFYHILLCKLLYTVIKNPFILQQIVNLFYLSAFLLVVFKGIRNYTPGIIILITTTPLILFFSCVPVIHASSLAAGAILAYTIIKVRTYSLNPVFIGIVFFISLGFRPDISFFLGPITLYFIIKHASLKQFFIIGCLGALITLSWYIPSQMLSGGYSPLKASSRMTQIFAAHGSLLYGATLFENIRSATRFLIYAFGVFGPGSLFFLIWYLRNIDKKELLVILIAVVPFLLYGIIIYLPYPNYYSPIVGFLLTWILLTSKSLLRPRILIPLALCNILFFLYFPEPQWESKTEDFKDRTITQNITKQFLYMGANSRATAEHPKKIMNFADSTIGKCRSYSIQGSVPERIWLYMSKYVWNNVLSYDSDSSCGILNTDNFTFHKRLYSNRQLSNP